jgi:hypothetical protein
LTGSSDIARTLFLHMTAEHTRKFCLLFEVEIPVFQ